MSTSFQISLRNVSVKYLLPKQPIRSFKEYFIHRLTGGRYDYREFWALRRVSLLVKSGTSLGIIGPNGAGKSTLLRVIAGIIKPVEGLSQTFGRIAPLIELGAGFDPELSGRENIYLNGSILGFSNREMSEKLNQIVEFSELYNFIDSPLRTYSSGMVSRLAFAIATDVKPEILIVDEILSVGDESFQSKCKKRMDLLRCGGVTTIVVSHSMTDIRRICDNVLWLDNGVVVETGSPGEIIPRYQRRISGD